MTAEVICSWCGKSQPEVKKMIVTAGAFWRKPPPAETSICNECVGLCMTVMAHEDRDWFEKAVTDAREFDAEPPKPADSN